jgi:hypothetical protein
VVALLAHLGGGSHLDDAPEVHDGHAVAQVRDGAEVVRDEEQAHRELLLQLLEQVQDLRLDRDIEGAQELVAHDEVGLYGEGAGDADALALAARELVRVAAHHVGAEAHLREDVGDHHVGLAAVSSEPEDGDALADDLAHGHVRVQRRVRILKDDLHAAAERAELLLGHLRDFPAVEEDAPRGGLDEAEDRAAERALSAARLAHEAERLAAADVERGAVDGVDDGGL